jgi:hypothetical protein
VLLALAGLVATVVAGSMLYGWWDRVNRTEPVAVAASPEPKREPPKPEMSALAPQVTETPMPQGTVQLAATEETWVSVIANGKTLFAGVLQPAETKRFEGIEQARLVTGNAAGLGVEWNGRAIGPIGPRGQVRLVLLNGQDARIVVPRGM